MHNPYHGGSGVKVARDYFSYLHHRLTSTLVAWVGPVSHPCASSAHSVPGRCLAMARCTGCRICGGTQESARSSLNMPQYCFYEAEQKHNASQDTESSETVDWGGPAQWRACL